MMMSVELILWYIPGYAVDDNDEGRAVDDDLNDYNTCDDDVSDVFYPLNNGSGIV